MGGITRNLLRQFGNWELPARIAFFTALALLLVMVAIGSTLPPEGRQYVLIGIVGLMIVTQFIFMWANRGMVKPYTKAQRHYLAGDFEAARDVLEADCAQGGCDASSLTLLGNIYRQLGDLEKSKERLTQALEMKPNHHFPLYGFGRTLLVEGRYAESASMIEQALSVGAPPTVYADLGEALYRAQGDRTRVIEALDAAREPSAHEPHRALLVAYLLYQLGIEDRPRLSLIAEGLPYWQATAERFAHTPYGQAVAQDVRFLTDLSGEHGGL
jgi:tetratricopeptide (TPR) repeat protein